MTSALPVGRVFLTPVFQRSHCPFSACTHLCKPIHEPKLGFPYYSLVVRNSSMQVRCELRGCTSAPLVDDMGYLLCSLLVLSSLAYTLCHTYLFHPRMVCYEVYLTL